MLSFIGHVFMGSIQNVQLSVFTIVWLNKCFKTNSMLISVCDSSHRSEQTFQGQFVKLSEWII